MEQKPKIALLGMTPDALAEVAAEAGLRRFAAGQMAKWIYDKRVSEIEEMTDLPKQARALLSEKYCIGTYAPKLVTESADGTRKYLFEGAGGRDVEAVYIPDGDRATLCVSSQAGCKMGCTFCMTGRQGFHGNLAASQILNQIFSIPESRSLTNIVFMGMGEPMDNLDEVLRAIDVLTAKWGLGWSPTRITVSTIGKLAEMKRLIETTKVHLAVSVHSPLPSQRAELMPVERAFPMVKIVDLLRKYDFAHQRRLTMEYIMWHGVNDTIRHAEALARLIKGTGARVNLIRFHAIPDSPLAPATREAMEAFRDRLNAIGVTATIRASRGEDIMAACGMLAGKQKDK
ncbi:MAG: 23S rRNA (adenine(2503)-C(2))-methyltransferase RlmN [Bacteroides sp.]|nr:23S rRNA (adenine(2503)-C(2))-methyltransferase RlmN [Bacteroides sp.]MCM1457529.1 23S rRNA (adenine(2503)-C(2))-methyltransferase RlmN [Lachnoclostridium sp.]